jgi:flavin-dependent dehydrogenase
MFDLIIIGAGPAGSALAWRMAEAGCSVLLCERKTFPRDTLCGEFLSPEARGYLDAIDAGNRVREAGPAPIRAAALVPARGRLLHRPLPAPGMGLGRMTLDRILVEHARSRGARFRDECRVGSVRAPGGISGPQGFEVEMMAGGEAVTEKSRLVVDAAGRHGGARWGGRRAGVLSGGSRSWVAFKRHYEGAAVHDPSRDRVEIYSFPGGYCGIAPVEGGRINLCFLGRPSDLRANGGRPEAMLEWAARENAALLGRLAGLLPAGEFLSAAGGSFARPGTPGVQRLAVGDAAGMIAPFCGDGVSMALRSAELMAPYLKKSLSGELGYREVLAEYSRTWWREFAGRIRLAGLLHRALCHPRGFEALAQAGNVWPRAADWVIVKTRGGTRPGPRPARARGGEIPPRQ